jgi:hypothetical protein
MAAGFLSRFTDSHVEFSVVESMNVIDTLLFCGNSVAIRYLFGPRITAGLFRDLLILAVYFDIFHRRLISSGVCLKVKKKNIELITTF